MLPDAPKLDLSTGFHGWTDVQVVAEWRLQRHAVQDRWRVLRPNDRVEFVGPEQESRQRFDSLCTEQGLAWKGHRYVVLLHGLARTGRCMRPLARAVSRAGEATPVRFFYSTTYRDIDAHAHALDSVLAELPAGSEVDFVGHSLGCIVIRRWFALQSTARDSIQPRRMVMLGPPNQGSQLAKVLNEWYAFRRFFGRTGAQLGIGWSAMNRTLADPPIEYGIIAGSVPFWLGCNPVLGRCSDWIVSVEETRLAGAKEHVTVPVPHLFLMASRRAIDLTLRFLQSGSFAAS